MDLSTSIRTVYFKKYADFKGRASRSEYWWAMGSYYAIFSVILLFGNLMYPENECVFYCAVYTGPQAIFDLFNLIVLIPFTALVYRRFHDINKSWWWIWVWVPTYVIWFVVTMVAMFLEVPTDMLMDETISPYAFFPFLFNNNAFIISLISWVLPMLYVVFYLPLKKGDKEANRFGEPPID